MVHLRSLTVVFQTSVPERIFVHWACDTEAAVPRAPRRIVVLRASCKALDAQAPGSAVDPRASDRVPLALSRIVVPRTLHVGRAVVPRQIEVPYLQ